jgi:nucleotide-binding universal stress UspA family protein
MFKRIIWATDGSEHADRALEIARSLASEGGGTLIAVHSVEYIAGPGSHGEAPELPDEDEREAKLLKQVNELAQQGISAELKIVQGGVSGAAHTVAKVAQEEGADLIVAGTRGHTPLAGLLLGSVAQRLVGLAPCPVLVVPV